MIRFDSQRFVILTTLLVVSACSGGGGGGSFDPGAAAVRGNSRSTSIALTSDDRRVVVVNRDTDSVSVIAVRGPSGADLQEKLAEIPVGREPRYVALSTDDRRAFVTNTVSGTVSVVELAGAHAFTVSHEIQVGSEPRGIAITPNGKKLFVANHTSSTVSVIDTATFAVSTVVLEGNPTALAISNDGDKNDDDETVFVTQFYAEAIPGGPGEVFDDGNQGVVWAFDVSGGAARKIPISPMEDVGFSADRAAFCAEFNPGVHSELFCPDTTETDALDPVIAADVQGGYPNQLQALLLRGGLLYVPNIAASPEPPVKFNVNVQAFVNVIDAEAEIELVDRHVNLNAQIKLEMQPTVAEGSLERAFGNDLVAIDGLQDSSKFYIVSRGGNYVIEAALDVNGALTIGAPANVVRYQTGNLPNGIAVTRDGRRAFVNNEVGLSVTAIDLENDIVLERDIPSATPPVPGTFAHGVAVGKLAFFTAMGLPDAGVFSTELRDLDPVQHRNKASDNGWSGCGSCHPDGLSDQVTWIFGTGPRQTLPLDAFFSKQTSLDQRISNWSAVMGSVTDFNNNARGVQNGTGFAGVPPPSGIFQHGITEGGSDSLDAMTLWVQTVRAPILPDAADPIAFQNGEQTFVTNCASCHAGAKWSKSQVVYNNNPTFDGDPNAGGVPLDAGVLNAGPQIRQFTEGGVTLSFLDDVGTFDPTNPAEIRGQAPTLGAPALGVFGYNAPSLLGLAYHAPYLHDGSAANLAQVFARHKIDNVTIQAALTDQERADLEVYLRAIDGSTGTHVSATDLFLHTLGK